MVYYHKTISADQGTDELNYSLLRISYAETSFLKRGRGACKVLYKLIFNLHKVVSLDCESIFCAMELFETCFVWLMPS